MYGLDVGFIWPILNRVVVTTSSPSLNFRHLVMGNPHEAAEPGTVPAETSIGPLPTQTPTRQPTAIQQVEPPPYENVAQTETDIFPEEPLRRSPSEPSRSSRHRIMAMLQHLRNRNSQSRRRRPVRWPHKASSVFACLCCVIGINNVSRFSMLVYIFKGCFILQFLLLSLIIGIPLLYLQMSLGQYLGAGMLDMWFISPAFKGLGFAMLYIYVLLGIYNAIPLSWLFIFFKDSFITLKDSYKWGKCHYPFARNGMFASQNCFKALNISSSDFYGWSVPSYFHGRVLGRKPGEYQMGELKFEVAFNLCLVWIIIFICLSRGPKTFGKVVYIFGLIPISLILMVTMRMGQQWSDGILDIFTSPWTPVLFDSNAWWLAAREAFVTWGLLGMVALHICSHNKPTTNITRSLIVVAVTAIILLVTTSFLFVCATNVFHKRNLSYSFSSYEEESSVKVLKPGVWPSTNLTVNGLLFGISVVPKDSLVYQSGYQVMRLVTEVFPAALAVEGVRSISSFWSICFYTAMILLGLGQQVVMWYCVVESLINLNYRVLKAWHTTLTFGICNAAFLLGLPITSNVGIYITYYLDFCLSSLWWLSLMFFILQFAVLFIKGRPYGTDQLVNVISQSSQMRSKILPFFTVMWNIVLPLSLLLLTISFLRTSPIDPSSAMGELMDNYRYWPRWAKTVNLSLQMFPLILIVTVGTYQAYRILKPRGDEKPFTERLVQFCCPEVTLPGSRTSFESTSISQGSTNSGFVDDPPPKYTPPPSYSTATSRILAKQLNLQRKMFHAVDCDTPDAGLNGDTVPSIDGMLSSQRNNA